MSLKFTVEAKDKTARAGIISTSRGVIKTPAFMPVGTAATVKAMFINDVRLAGADIILGNVYHLMLRPGAERIARLGGLHKFMNWPYPILTDSGGFQVMSLSKLRKLSEEGVVFQSHIDGSAHLFTPESVMDIQRSIGADIVMAFDECPPGDCDRAYATRSLALTHRWLDRCVEHFTNTQPLYGYTQNLFPIVQGGSFKDLRKESCEYIASKEATGHAIGGLSVGEPEPML